MALSWKPIVKRLFGTREKEVSLLGRSFWVVPYKDFYVYRIALALRAVPSSRELALVMSLLAFIRRGDVFIDVGANVGLFSRLIGDYEDVLDLHVIAIEPNPDTARRLRHTLQSLKKAIVIEAACSDKEGEASLLLTGDSLTSLLDRGAGSIDYAKRWGWKGGHVRVKTVTIDGILGALSSREAVVKVDVEGHEREVVLGAMSSLKEGKIRVLIVDGGGGEVDSLVTQFGYAQLDPVTLRSSEGRWEKLFVRRDLV